METFALLVPCFNAEKHIDVFLKNLQSQEKQFDEVIFYDDASTDNTASLLRQSGYKVISGSENGGPSVARNRLALESTSTWIHFHDIDDLLDNTYLKKVSIEAVTRHIDVVLCNVDWFDSKRENCVISWKYSNELIHLDPLAYTIENPIGGINGMYRKTLFQKIGGFDENLRQWEDADLHVRLAWNNCRFFVVEEVLAYAIRHSNSLSLNQKDAWLTRAFLLKRYFKNFKSLPTQLVIGKEAQRAASQLILYHEFESSTQMLLLSEACGVSVPNSNRIIWRLIKAIIPYKLRINLRIIQLRLAFGK